MINTSIGKYKIIKLIGEGGMASVYEAEHEMLGTKVAIKVLNPILSANAEIKTRFRNEAKLMASLDHPNITKVIDFDEQPQQLSIVMEFLNGEDLDEKIKRNGQLSEKEIRDIFSQTLSAFQYAHEKGIVHRDIKPSNIFILSNGHVKILDFGIAKLFGEGNEMTQTGIQIGTPNYMSPEQVKADKSIDHRSDLYSIGVTLYFASSGRSPYNSANTSQFDVYNKIVHEPLPTISSNVSFNEIIGKACQKDREQRFQSCQEFMVAMNIDLGSESHKHSTYTSDYSAKNRKKSTKKKVLFVGGIISIGLVLFLTLGLPLLSSIGNKVYEGDFKDWNYSDTKVYGLLPLEDTRNRDYFKITQVSEGLTKVEEFNECGILKETTILKYQEDKLQSISTTNQSGFNYKNQVFTNLNEGLEEIEKNQGQNTNLPSKSMVNKFEDGLLIESKYRSFDGKIGVGPQGFSQIKYVPYDDENRWGLIKELTYYDENGNPTQYGNYHKIIYDRDERGNVIKMSFWDSQNKAVLNDLGVHLIKYAFDNLDNEIEETYHGISDETVTNDYGIGGVRYEYVNGKCISLTRYTSTGVIATASTLENLDKASIVKYEYDIRGNEILATYYDELKNITKTTAGYYKVSRQYDELDNITVGEYLGEFGDRLEDEMGIHRYSYTYDQLGRKTSMAFYDKFLNQTDKSYTYFMIKYKYEETGLMHSQSYWRNNDVKMGRWSGEHEENYKYNDQGQELESYYLDEQGSLKKTQFGSSRIVTKYDQLARVTSVTYFDGDSPSSVVGTTVAGYHSIHFKYDNHNKLISIEYFDENDEPKNIMVQSNGNVSRIELLYKGNNISSQKWFLANSNIPTKVLDCYNSECMTTAGLVMRFLNK